MPEMGGNRTEATEGTSPDNTASGDMQTPQMPGGQGGMQMPGQSGDVDNTSSTDETTEIIDDSQQFPGFGGRGGMELPEGMEIPEGMENMQPGQIGNAEGGFPDRGQTGTGTTQGGTQWIMLGIAVVILAAGLLFAFKYKR